MSAYLSKGNVVRPERSSWHPCTRQAAHGVIQRLPYLPSRVSSTITTTVLLQELREKCHAQVMKIGAKCTSEDGPLSVINLEENQHRSHALDHPALQGDIENC